MVRAPRSSSRRARSTMSKARPSASTATISCARWSGPGDHALTVTLDGGETCTAGVSLVRLKRRKLGTIKLATVGGDALRPSATSADRVDFRVPANGRFILTWAY